MENCVQQMIRGQNVKPLPVKERVAIIGHSTVLEYTLQHSSAFCRYVWTGGRHGDKRTLVARLVIVD